MKQAEGSVAEEDPPEQPKKVSVVLPIGEDPSGLNRIPDKKTIRRIKLVCDLADHLQMPLSQASSLLEGLEECPF